MASAAKSACASVILSNTACTGASQAGKAPAAALGPRFRDYLGAIPRTPKASVDFLVALNQRVQRAIQAREPQRRVALAFLEFMEPTLEQCVAQLAEEGVTSICLAPMFMAQSGHLKRDLPLQVEAAARQHPQLSIHIAGAIGEAPGVIDAMAEHILALD